MPHEIRDVLESLAQGRQAERHYVEPVEQILAEQALIDLLLDVTIGGGDDADIGPYRGAAADGCVFALLEHPQQLGLCLHRHVADLIEKQRAAFGLLEAPDMSILRAGEGALLVAEQLGLDQLARDGRHVYGDERSVAALAVFVQRAGD